MKSFLSKNKIFTALSAAIAWIAMYTIPAYAGGTSIDLNLPDVWDADQLGGQLAIFIFQAGIGVGIIMAAIGGIAFLVSKSNNDANAKITAVWLLVAGAGIAAVSTALVLFFS